jgi:threonine-phosphate decarboxylase
MHKIPPPYTDPAPLFRHGGAVRRGAPGTLDFSVSTNPLGPPGLALDVLRHELASIGRYPDPYSSDLAQRLEAYHGLAHADAPAEVVVGNGSNELIYAIARAFRPQRVAIAEPAYTEFLRASLLVEAEVDHWLADGDDFALEPFHPGGADLVWLCNPNNPTGQMWPRAADMVPWMDAHPRTLFVVDESFLPLSVVPGVGVSLIPALGRLSNLIVLRSLTKWYALPGLRLGYAALRPGLAHKLRGQLGPWSVNVLAQAAGLGALDDHDYRARTQEWLADQQPTFRDRLAAVSQQLRPLPSSVNFVLARLEGVVSGWLCNELLGRGIAIRDAANFVGLDQHYVRIAIRTAEDNERLFDELRTVLRSGGKPWHVRS